MVVRKPVSSHLVPRGLGWRHSEFSQLSLCPGRFPASPLRAPVCSFQSASLWGARVACGSLVFRVTSLVAGTVPQWGPQSLGEFAAFTDSAPGGPTSSPEWGREQPRCEAAEPAVTQPQQSFLKQHVPVCCPLLVDFQSPEEVVFDRRFWFLQRICRPLHATAAGSPPRLQF